MFNRYLKSHMITKTASITILCICILTEINVIADETKEDHIKNKSKVTNSKITLYQGHSAGSNPSITYSLNGRFFATSSSSEAKLWTSDGTFKKNFHHKDHITGITFNRDNNLLITVTEKKIAGKRYIRRINYWNFNGKLTKELLSDSKSIAFTNKNRIVKFNSSFENMHPSILSQNKKYIIYYDTHTKIIRLKENNGTLLGTFKTKEPVASFCESNSGKKIATQSKDSITIWSTEGKLLTKKNINYKSICMLGMTVVHNHCLNFSPDENYLISGVPGINSSSMHIWNLKKNKLITINADSKPYLPFKTAFNPDGKSFISITQRGTIRIWNIDGTMMKNIEAVD